LAPPPPPWKPSLSRTPMPRSSHVGEDMGPRAREEGDVEGVFLGGPLLPHPCRGRRQASTEQRAAMLGLVFLFFFFLYDSGRAVSFVFLPPRLLVNRLNGPSSLRLCDAERRKQQRREMLIGRWIDARRPSVGRPTSDDLLPIL
jgi:hypothetical protein